MHSFRTPFLKNTSGGLLLNVLIQVLGQFFQKWAKTSNAINFYTVFSVSHHFLDKNWSKICHKKQTKFHGWISHFVANSSLEKKPSNLIHTLQSILLSFPYHFWLVLFSLLFSNSHLIWMTKLDIFAKICLKTERKPPCYQFKNQKQFKKLSVKPNAVLKAKKNPE